jgi:hypothetical protein
METSVSSWLLDTTFERVCGEPRRVTLHSNPGLFYVCLGEAIADQKLAPWCYLDHVKVAVWCYRQAGAYTCPLLSST